MSRPLENHWKGLLMGYCSALLMSLGMSLTLLQAFAPQQALWPIAPLCAGLTLAFHALFQSRFRGKNLLLTAVFLALVLWGLLGGGPGFSFVQMCKAAWVSFQGVPDAMTPYAATARWVICLLFSLLGAALYWDHTVVLAVFTVVSMVGISFLFGQNQHLLLYSLPAAAGILLMMAGEDGKRFSVLTVAAALVAAAFFLLPGQPKAVSPFKEAAESIRQFVEDYLLFNEYRSAFSLVSEGFQPLDERLGGPADPAEHSVLEVQTNRTVLLRGKTYDEYTGLNWYDTLSSRRYLSVSPRFTALREELFDLNRPLAGDGALTPLSLHAHALNQGTTTLFAPGRTRSLTLEGERMVLYYNTAGEYFLTRNVEAGDAYSLSYLPFAAGDAATEALVKASAPMEDGNYQEIARNYLQIPSHIQSEIYEIAARATAGKSSPYEKALALRNYLRRNYRYTLDTQIPPEGVDFIAWFLIGEKQGYCTYFASAMTMLCRIVGLPARYVTGYVAIPDENGVALVTGKYAHAWTEVYLNGFGWLAFDATPRSDTGGDDVSVNDPPPPSQENPAPAPSPSPAPAQPSESPAETPTPAPEDQPTENHSLQAPTPTPVPPPPEQAPPDASPPNPPQEDNQKRFSFPWWLLILLAAISLFALRAYYTEPVRQSLRHPENACVILLTAASALLARRGVRREPQETLHDFGLKADEALRQENLPSVLPLISDYEAQLYGKHRLGGQKHQAVYLALRNAASPLTRFFLMTGRVFTFRRK